LTHLKTRKLDNAVEPFLQDISYIYDPVGNIIKLTDNSHDKVFNNNQEVEASTNYNYDALYRLIDADGRMHTNLGESSYQTGFKQSEFASSDTSDTHNLINYTRRYSYDTAGNLTKISHLGGFTRNIEIDEASNRGFLKIEGESQTHADYFDENGNMKKLNHISEVKWNYRDNIQSATIIKRQDGKNDAEFYIYDSGGERVRKVFERYKGNGLFEIEEKIYLGGVEIKRIKQKQGDAEPTKIFERSSLHIMDDSDRIAISHNWIQDDNNREANILDKNKTRYQYGNHLGSASLELDSSGLIISYEEYFPYGGTSFTTGKSQSEVKLKEYRYTGKERDDSTGLYYYGARYYAPWLGRWMSADPAMGQDGLNLYVYVRNNPIKFIDPDGKSKTSKQQYQEVISIALEKMANGNRTAKGKAAEVVLEGMLKKAGHIIIKGPVANSGSHFADIVTYDPKNGELFFFDNKFQGKKKSVSRVDAFSETKQKGVINDAYEKFKSISDDIPEKYVDDIEEAFDKLKRNPDAAKFVVSNASPKMIKNFAEKLSDRILARGIKFADASGGSKKLQGAIDEIADEAKNLEEAAGTLSKTSKFGKKLVKSLPIVGLILSGTFAVPRVAEAREEDLAYEEMMYSMGAEPQFKNFNTLRELSVIAGEESGGELGGWGGAGLGALLTSGSGPGMIIGAGAGALIFGFGGDWAGGELAGYLFDLAAEERYNSIYK